jgi:hypothetical protein
MATIDTMGGDQVDSFAIGKSGCDQSIEIKIGLKNFVLIDFPEDILFRAELRSIFLWMTI